MPYRHLLRPHKLQDICPGSSSVFSSAATRVNLRFAHKRSARVVGALKYVGVLLAAGFLVFPWAIAPTNPTLAQSNPQEERRALEAQLQQLEAQIGEYQNQISSYNKQGKTLKGEIGRLNDKIAQLNLQIRAVNLTLSDLDQKIADTQFRIVTTQRSIVDNTQTLAQLLRTVNTSDQANTLEIFFKHPQLSDFFGDINHVVLLQGNVRATIRRITSLRDQLKDHKDQLALARADAQTIKEYRASQKQETDQVKKQKADLLEVTKGQESKYQDLLKKTKETAAQIRSRIFQLLGGGELKFEDAYKFARLASQATGVRPAFILAILDRESALGQNVGKCSYHTAMSPSNQPIFLDITRELNINPETITVSCANADGAYGGAMGPAQFIPTTWQGYREAISAITGNTPPSPWNNADAFTAAALYLKDAGAQSNERVAAAKYYCGGKWNRYVCLNVYGKKVIEHADAFQQDIEEISN